MEREDMERKGWERRHGWKEGRGEERRRAEGKREKEKETVHAEMPRFTPKQTMHARVLTENLRVTKKEPETKIEKYPICTVLLHLVQH